MPNLFPSSGGAKARTGGTLSWLPSRTAAAAAAAEAAAADRSTCRACLLSADTFVPAGATSDMLDDQASPVGGCGGGVVPGLLVLACA